MVYGKRIYVITNQCYNFFKDIVVIFHVSKITFKHVLFKKISLQVFIRIKESKSEVNAFS